MSKKTSVAILTMKMTLTLITCTNHQEKVTSKTTPAICNIVDLRIVSTPLLTTSYLIEL